MSKSIPFAALALVALCATPYAARAGAAGGGSLGCASTAQIRYVVDANGNGLRDTGENTTCSAPFVDDTNNDEPVVHNGSLGGPVCVPASLAQMRGTLSLIADDNGRDNNNGNTGQVVAIVLDVMNQDKTFRLADTFPSQSGLGNLIIGNWDNRVQNEFNVFGVKFKGALFLTPAGVNPGALSDLGAQLAQIAQSQGLIPNANDVIPVIASASRDAARKRMVQSSASGCADTDNGIAAGCGELEVDQSGVSQPLASVAVYRLTISFAEKLVGSPPTCQ
ncbi:MAG TPA: hypothetical protein VFY49_01630 [Myxococcota bacterium]|nr:hypothetical protein [Myxococcota bacterium]